jgi:hypothetical protein
MRTVKVWRRPAVGAPVLLSVFPYNPQAGWPAPNPEWFGGTDRLQFVDSGPTVELNRIYDAFPPSREGERWWMVPELRRQLDALRITAAYEEPPWRPAQLAQDHARTLREQLHVLSDEIHGLAEQVNQTKCSTCRWLGQPFVQGQVTEPGQCMRLTSGGLVLDADQPAYAEIGAAFFVAEPDEFACFLWEAPDDDDEDDD